MARCAAISRELGLLAACGLASNDALESRIVAALSDGFDWPRFKDLAIGHGMGGIAGARLAEVAPGAVPEDIAKSLQRVLRIHTALQLAQTAEAAGLTARFAKAGIGSIVLKGVALSHMFYAPNPQWRSASDIDILISPQNLLEADRLLRSEGYTRTWPRQDLPEDGLDMFLLLANVFNYVSPANGQLVELHHRPTLNPHWMPESFDELHAASLEIETDSGPVRGLDGPLLMAYLCWHALGHIGYRLKWFCDISLALGRMSARERAGTLVHSRRPVEIAAEVLAIFAPANEEPPRGQSDSRWRQVVHRILHDMENVSDMPTSRSLAQLPEEIANQMFLMKLSPRMRAKAYQVFRTACDPRDVYVLELRRKWTILYAALGPLFAARRLLFPAQPAPVSGLKRDSSG